MRAKPFRVGDEVVVINGRRWVAYPARTSVVEQVCPRHVYIKGHSDPLDKRSVVHRSPKAESLGVRLDILDALEDERQREVYEATHGIEERYARVSEGLRDETRRLYAELER